MLRVKEHLEASGGPLSGDSVDVELLEILGVHLHLRGLQVHGKTIGDGVEHEIHGGLGVHEGVMSCRGIGTDRLFE